MSMVSAGFVRALRNNGNTSYTFKINFSGTTMLVQSGTYSPVAFIPQKWITELENWNNLQSSLQTVILTDFTTTITTAASSNYFTSSQSSIANPVTVNNSLLVVNNGADGITGDPMTIL